MTKEPMSLIERRRRQLHVHSVIYYHLNTSIVADALFDAWALELVKLHKQFPKAVSKGYEWREFSTWTGDTGMHLPVNERVMALAVELVKKTQRNDSVVGLDNQIGY